MIIANKIPTIPNLSPLAKLIPPKNKERPVKTYKTLKKKEITAKKMPRIENGLQTLEIYRASLA